jgi:hypothetical protein
MLVYSFKNKITQECLYIGSTGDFKARMRKHKSDCLRFVSDLYHVINDIGWDNVLIETVSSNLTWTLKQLREEERNQIELLKPIYNSYRPMRNEEEKKTLVNESKKKCYEAKKDEYLAVNKKYREANKEQIAAKAKEWREANREILLAKKKAYRESKKV